MRLSLYQTIIVVCCGLLAAQTAAITIDRNITIGMTFSLSAPTPLARVDQGRRTNDGTVPCTSAAFVLRASFFSLRVFCSPLTSSYDVLGVLFWYENLPNKVIYVGNQTIGVNIVIYDDRADAATMRSLYTQMASDPSIDFLVGPVNSDFSIMAKTITEPRRA